ncbi:hypothetical protein ACQEU5_15020 [Marinactinospora thermotolerans]|uniref:Uncharacterized protein n=1 Tax=Marinactinospora thermotolerans DSM 45154 TaxID=1122192 RepID=A0A1T4RMI8_9ACTN|nr:hypothetical protein [Marinactinospora thermotolerans]SKA17225.1 hypothetical protein SAMN02745673_02812 [Marinactinospora thermotolerans DSM 45154]
MTGDVRGWGTAPAALIVAIALSGCAGGTPAESGPSTPGGEGVSSPAAPPAPASPAGPEAADGEDLGACADADCEVIVHQGDEIVLDPADHGLDGLTVEEAGDGRVAFAASGPGVSLRTSYAGTVGSGGKTSHLNGIAITTLEIGADHAVIRLTPP